MFNTYSFVQSFHDTSSSNLIRPKSTWNYEFKHRQPLQGLHDNRHGSLPASFNVLACPVAVLSCGAAKLCFQPHAWAFLAYHISSTCLALARI